MTFVLDTNVVSELRPARTGRADPDLVAWAESVTPSALFLSVMTVLELEVGIQRVARRDPAQAESLRAWMENGVRTAFAGRVLPFGENTAILCAGLHVPDDRPDRDAMIAATAMQHASTVVTRNVSDYAPTSVPILNPWDTLR
ncbi:type II toxin-antitoxin system VapC family toxin [Jannaschia sp. LMIT008]|uniref:type II toxin-antitoxin system VapC family toxin n=1 Tax=Jannaschia maritima TaxID=3032585 RepID=UPI0028110EA4|nr:type II toxin-antitoxin system VapC family toxin [Jannaschia sp. LMIT008]